MGFYGSLKIKKLFLEDKPMFEITKIENRIALLSARDPIANARIINKLRRRLRRLTENN